MAVETPQTPRKPRRPAGLGTAGARLWASIFDGDTSGRADEIAVAEQACRTADAVAQLDEALKGEPLTVPGSAGQLREHPLLSEVRLQRALLARLLSQLDLPDDDEMDEFRAWSKGRSAKASARSRSRSR